jgi:hypothetical protein
MIWRLEEEFKDLNEQWLALDQQHPSQPIIRKQNT